MAPEFLSLKGKLLLSYSPENAAEVESLYQLAITTPRELDAPMFELRARDGLEPLVARARQNGTRTKGAE